MTQRNVRSLDEIAAIHKLGRNSIIEIGDLLLEAKDQRQEYRDWVRWLDSELEWSYDTAQRYMKVAALSSKFRNLRDLKLGATTLYELADYKSKEYLPAIIKELAKHATRTRLAPRGARKMIKIGIGRHCFGDYPDAALVQLVEVDNMFVGPWREKAIAALRKQVPSTDEAARAIVSKINKERESGAAGRCSCAPVHPQWS
jgi:hypothetical protein